MLHMIHRFRRPVSHLHVRQERAATLGFCCPLTLRRGGQRRDWAGGGRFENEPSLMRIALQIRILSETTRGPWISPSWMGLWPVQWELGHLSPSPGRGRSGVYRVATGSSRSRSPRGPSGRETGSAKHEQGLWQVGSSPSCEVCKLQGPLAGMLRLQ